MALRFLVSPLGGASETFTNKEKAVARAQEFRSAGTPAVVKRFQTETVVRDQLGNEYLRRP